jgi:hypothetical protein
MKAKKKIKVKNLKDLIKGDLVLCTGDSYFCDPSQERISKITIQYNEKTGEPYNVIWVGANKFDSRDGSALNPPLAYYLLSLEEDKIKERLDKLNKIKK